jgi:uncharacterized membrane protein YidH (DUF202 family)
VDDVRLRVAAWWLGLTVIGVVIVALPDSDDPVFTLSDNHGPGVVDLIGIAVVLVGTAVLYRHLLLTRETIVAQMGRSLAIVLAVSWVVAIAALVAAVLLDRGLWWLVGAVDATAAQGFALAMSAPTPDPDVVTTQQLDEDVR